MKATIAAAFRFACPQCGRTLESLTEDRLYCTADQLVYRRRDGIWRFLTDERARELQPFLDSYAAIRQAEGRGSDDPAYFHALPDRDLSGRFSADWAIRARSFTRLIDTVIEPMERNRSRPLRIVDLGAGNGWLSNRLALRGHAVAAIDLSLDPRDGLGAHKHYEASFDHIQADFDRLPLDAGQVDLAVFNASLHYTIDAQATLSETLRVLESVGRVVIVDTPVYRDPQAGERMVEERRMAFEQMFGLSGNARSHENYLTHERLDSLAETLHLEWELQAPVHPLRWRLGRRVAGLRLKREIASFPLLVGRRVD